MPSPQKRVICSAVAPVIEMLESRRMLTTAVLAGSGAFSISYNSTTQQYSFTGGGVTPSPIAAAGFTGFTLTGAGANDSLTITSGSPTLLNDAGEDGTSLAVIVSPGASLNFNTTEHLSSLSIGSGASARMLSNGHQVLVTNSLSLAGSIGAWTSTLDLGDNDLIVHAGSLTTLGDQVKSGFNAARGYWNGTGISSSDAAGNAKHLTAIGVIANQYNGSAFLTSFDSQTVTSTDILVKYTYYGDTNLDGKVDGTDYSRIDSGALTRATGWFNGDLNYDGTINGSDYTLIDNAFNTQGKLIGSVSSVPSFQVGANETVAENALPQSFAGWVTNINSGVTSPNQTLTFSVSNNNNSLFSTQPAIAADGSLLFTPAANAVGTATITVSLTNSSNLASKNTSGTQSFTITVAGVDQTLRTVLADYDLVHNSVAFQAYYGEMKGPTATAQIEAGNAWDQAAYLQQLLQNSGISAQLVTGYIQINGQMASQWLGTTAPDGSVTSSSVNAAYSILGISGILANQSINSNNPAQSLFAVSHAWVQVTGGSFGTINLDPSWKYDQLQAGIPNILSSVPYSFTSYTSSTDPSQELAYEYYESKVTAYLQANDPGKTLADVPHTGPIIASRSQTVPAYPYYVLQTNAPASSFSAADQHQVTIAVNSSTGRLIAPQTFNVSNVALNYPTITYIASGSNLIPELVVNGVTTKSATAVAKGSAVSIIITSVDPNDQTPTQTFTFPRAAGQDAVVTLDAQQASAAYLASLQSNIFSAEQAYASSPSTNTAAVVDSILQYTGARYWNEFNSQLAIIDGLTAAVEANDAVGVGLVTNYISKTDPVVDQESNILYVNVPHNVLVDLPGISFIGVPLDGSGVLDPENTPRSELITTNASGLENQIIEEITNAPSISTVKGLYLAATQGIAIEQIPGGTASSTVTQDLIHYPSNISSGIATDIANGYTVTLPVFQVSQGRFTGATYFEEKLTSTSITEGFLINNGTVPAHGGAEDGLPDDPPLPLYKAPLIPVEPTGGDPIGLDSGNVSRSETDLSLPDFGQNLSFSRQYDSSATVQSTVVDHSLGIGWISNYGDYLTLTSTQAVWFTTDGHQYTFNLSNGVFTTPGALSGTLTLANSVYTYTDTNGDFRQFEVVAGSSAAQLIEIGDRDNNILKVTHNSAGKIASVYDTQNTSYALTFTYNSTGDLSQLQDPTGRIWTYSYTQLLDGNYYLTQVNSPSDGSTPQLITRYTYYNVTNGLLNGLLNTVSQTDATDGQTSATHTTTFTYYPDRRGFQVTDPNGNTTQVFYELFRYTTDFFDERGNVTVTTYNGSTGLTTKQINPDQTTDLYSYSVNHDLITLHTNPFDDTTTYSYDYGPNDTGAGVGNLLQTVDSFTGTVTSYTYESAAKFYQLASVTVTAGGISEVTQYAHDNNGNTTSITDAGNDVTTMTYGSRGQVLSRTTPDGNTAQPTGDYTTNFTYNPVGEVLTTATAGLLVNGQPATTTDTYDSHYALASVTDPTGVVTAYANDLLGRRISQTLPDPDGTGPLRPLVTTYKLDAFGNELSTTDPRGLVTQNIFDAKNELTETINSDGTETFTAYDPSGNVAQTTDALGNVMLFVFNSMNRQVEVVNPDNSSRFVQYAANGAVALTVDENGYTTTNAYDMAGRLISTTDASGAVTRNTYDGFGNLLETAFYPVGSSTPYSATSYQYDLLNRPVESQGPQGTFQTTAYDADGNTVKQVQYNVSGDNYDASGISPGLTNAQGQSVSLSSLPAAQQQITATTYDVLDRPIVVSAPILAGASMPLSTATSYDAAGRVLTTTDQRNLTTTYGYDAAGRQVSVTIPNPTNTALAGLTTTYTLDADGNTITTADPAGNVTTDTYALKSNRLIAVTIGTASTYTTFDGNGNAVATTDGDGNRTIDTYDSLNRLIAETQPSPGGTTTYSYYADSRLNTVIDADGRKVVYAYYAFGPVGRETWYANASSTTALDTLNSTYNSDEQLASETDTNSATYYSYDYLNRVTTQSVSNSGQQGISYYYFYDGFGNLSEREIGYGGPIIQTITNTYDADNRLTQQIEVTPGNFTTQSTAVTQQINYTLNADGQITGVARYQSAAGSSPVLVATTTTTYDNDGRATNILDQQGSTTLDSFQYTYNNASQIIGATTALDGSTAFTYDSAGEVATATYSANAGFNETYTFDGAGNNTANTTAGDNRLTSDGTFTYTYDAEGNLLTRTRISQAAASDYLTLYTWDNRNRLTQVVTENNQGTVTNTVSYVYDVENRRIAETVNGVSTFFSYANDDNVALTFNTSGASTVVLYDPNSQEISQIDASNSVRMMLNDVQGSVRDVVVLNGATTQIVDHLFYNSFGKVVIETNPATPHLLGYAGQQPDAAVGLNYDQARYYNPQTGRFVSQDPSGLAAGDPNLYRYVFNDPVDFVDPGGLHIELPSVEDEFGGDDFDSEGLSTPSYESRQTSSESFEDDESDEDSFADSSSRFSDDDSDSFSSNEFGNLSSSDNGSSLDSDQSSEENNLEDDEPDDTPPPPPPGGPDDPENEGSGFSLTPIFNAAARQGLSPVFNAAARQTVDEEAEDIEDEESQAAEQLQQLQDASEGAHFLSRHGASTTLAQQLVRSQIGLTPDGESKNPSNATRFFSNQLQLAAALKAQELFQQNGDRAPIFEFGSDVGEGYKAGGLSYGTTSLIQAVFRNGLLYNLYPKLR